MPAVSVVLTTYERPQALACVLEKYRDQSFGDFEIVVGDDGSGDATREVIERYKALLPVPLVHVWTPHQDHGRTRVINNAVRHSSGEYLIFSDGDCIPEENFVEVHAASRKPGCFLNGRRLMLPKRFVDIAPGQVRAREHQSHDEVKSSWDDIHIRERKSVFYRLLGPLAWDRLRLLGANFSMWRKDYDAINGYDEGYVGWGAADEDFRRRLNDVGIIWRSVMKTALLWHIPHPPIESKPATVKEGRNASRYDSGVYLTRPLLGVTHRPPESLSICWPDGTDIPGTVPHPIETTGGTRDSRHEVMLTVVTQAQPTIPSRPPGRCNVVFVPPGTSVVTASVPRGYDFLIRAGAPAGERIMFQRPGKPSSGVAGGSHPWPGGEPVGLSDLPPAEPGETPGAYAARMTEPLRCMLHSLLR